MTREISEIKDPEITGIISVPGSDPAGAWVPEWDVLFTDPGHVGFVDPQTGEHWRISLKREEASALGSLLMRMTSELEKARGQAAKAVTGQVEKVADDFRQACEGTVAEGDLPQWKVDWTGAPFLEFAIRELSLGLEKQTFRVDLPTPGAAKLLGMFLGQMRDAALSSRLEVCCRDLLIEKLKDQIAHDREGMFALRRKYGAVEGELTEEWISRLYGEAQLHREEEIRQINGWAHGKSMTDETVELARGIAQQINLLEERLVKMENQAGPFRLMVTGVSGIPPNGLTEVVASLVFAPAGSWLEIERSALIVGDPAALEGHLSRMLDKYNMKETSRPVTVAEMDRLRPDWRTARWHTDEQVGPEMGIRLNPGGLPPTVPQEEPESRQQPVPSGCGTDQGDPDPEGNQPGVVKLGADGLPVDLQAEAIREVLQHNPRFDRWTSVACPACDRMTLGATRSAGMIPRITLKCSNCGFQVDI